MRRWHEHPEWLLVTVAAVCAIVFANHAVGAIGFATVIAAAGAAVAKHAHRIPARIRHPREGVAKWIAYGAVFALTVWTFWDQFTERGWMLGDYPGQHAALAQLVPALEHGHIPTYSVAIGTGDAPFETYPALTYVVAACASIVTGSDRLVDILVIVGIVAHGLVTLNIVRLVYRVARPWTAVVIGVIALFDSGSVSGGGLVGTIEWGLIHSALALAIFSFAVVAVHDLLTRPRLARAITIWIATALATATHPSALLVAGGSMVALLFVALLARGPARHPLVAIAHLGIGCALGAVVWMPLGERMLLYAQHFSNALRSPAQLLEELLAVAHPPSWFAGVVYAGYVGLVLAMWSRDARKMFLGAAGVMMLLGFLDTPLVQLGLAPSEAASRIGVDRFHSLVRPFTLVAAGYLLAVVATQLRTAWSGTKLRERAFLGAVLAIVIAMGMRATVPLVIDLRVAARELSYRSGFDRKPLIAWAHEQMKTMGPGNFARAVFEDGDGFQHMHLTAETGLSTFHLGPMPGVMLRERIEDLTPASIRRFNVRWIVERNASPSKGDPKTEQIVGKWRIREFPEWDGQFARIERGGGSVRTTELTDERIRVELANTSAPSLVALGIGYYPRWRARDANGKPVKVYAFPTKPGGQLHVVAAWISPGVTTFTADAPLPSDGKGRGLAALALLVACATVVVWTRTRWRIRVLRGFARLRRRVALRRVRIVMVAVLSIGLLVWGFAARGEPMRALQIGSTTRGYATIHANLENKPAEECGYHRVEGRYRCAGVAAFFDTTDVVVNDAQALWPFTTPSVHVVGVPGKVVLYNLRVKRRLAGTYWIGSTGGPAVVKIDELPSFATLPQQTRTFEDREYTIQISGDAPPSGISVAFVRVDAIEPDRSFLAPPPLEAPAP
jgi:hypothetical protein